jgi:hypothetical protein
MPSYVGTGQLVNQGRRVKFKLGSFDVSSSLMPHDYCGNRSRLIYLRRGDARVSQLYCTTLKLECHLAPALDRTYT